MLLGAVALLDALVGQAQSPGIQGSAILTGAIRDSQSRPVGGAEVRLQAISGRATFVAHTDAEGLYRFPGLQEGAYSVRAEKNGVGNAEAGPFKVATAQPTQVDLTLVDQKVAFFDEPTFTIAGVTDSTYLGGHGSEGTMRSKETLTKATATLAKDARGSPPAVSGTVAEEMLLREAVAHEPENFEANYGLGKFLVTEGRAGEGLPYLERAAKLDPGRAKTHQLLGDAYEQMGDALGAVHEYQRAVELDANEPNLFNWGAELLVHRAVVPAIEVFTRGNRLFPQSSRMLLALASAFYAQGDYNQAARRFFEACDLNPVDAGPYLFMAQVQSVEITHQPGFIARLERFARLQPDSAWAKYYYATSRWNTQTEPDDAERSKISGLLEEAIRLDPRLGAAYLQLGNLYSEHKDYARAVAAYEKAVEASPELEQAHYRLGRVYARMGKEQESRRELDLFEELSKKSAAKVMRERNELQQFVVALRKPSIAPAAGQATQPQ
jgi:tetratricopeptide (TPR) repeat protein